MHHTGVVVRDIELHYQKYMQHFLPGGLGEIYFDSLQEAKVTFLVFGDSRIELVEPTNPKSPMSRLLEKKPATYHHICLLTDDIDRQLDECREVGQFVVSPPKPAVAFGGKNIAFVMGRDGLLWELLQE